MFKTKSLIDLTAAMQLQRICTHMYFFGHDLQKTTHLLGNMPGLENLQRTMTAADKKRLAAKNDKRKNKRIYYTIKNKKVSGGKDLHKTSVYTRRFADALFAQWRRHRFGA